MNKTEDIAQGLIDMAYRGARSIIARGEEACPMGFVYSAEENAVAPLPMSYTMSKYDDVEGRAVNFFRPPETHH